MSGIDRLTQRSDQMALVRFRWPVIKEDDGTFWAVEDCDEWYEVDCTTVSACDHETTICPVCLNTWHEANTIVLVDRNHPEDYTNLDTEALRKNRRDGIPETSLAELLAIWFGQEV